MSNTPKESPTNFTEEDFIQQKNPIVTPNSQIEAEEQVEKSKFYKVATKKAIKVIASRNKMFALINKAYTHFNNKENERPMSQEVKDKFKTLLRLIRALYKKEYKDFPWGSLVKATATIIYLVSPLDLVPDFIPFIGMMDDFALISWTIGSLSDDIKNFEDWEEAQQIARLTT
ncbi:YkvA family protein [Bernardetia sp. Wsw4-3y2]|uniref:YkvA family protein n=1 Tax=unclassified Bernardetia TaxID=2647129 RepID=UPI0030D12865